MNKYCFKYRSLDFEYTAVFEDRKSISIIIYPSLNVVVKAPNLAKEEDIYRFLKRKYFWVLDQFDFFSKFLSRTPKQYISGESIFYLGKMYRLLVKDSNTNSVKLIRGDLVVCTTRELYNGKYNKKLIDAWYLNHANIIFNKRLKEISKNFKDIIINDPSLSIRKMNKRWGSYSSDKNKVYLNVDLIKSSQKCIDYVISHELCHIKYANHSKDFYSLLSAKLPNYQVLKQELEEKFL